MRRLILAVLALGMTGTASAGDVCPTIRQQQFSTDTATRVAAVACNENMLWYRPFIDSKGRMASATVSEAEASRLGDGATEAWRRVAIYWRESGLLWQMSGFPGASDCGYAGNERSQATSCRAFVVDTPWSAAFVSYVMKKADVPGFRASASHFDYVRDAYLHPDGSPFHYLDPVTAKPAAGDLLCYVRTPGRIYGYQGLAAAISGGSDGLNMHCDIVVAANPGNDGKAYSIGGNVQQGVTMRLLDINRNGNFWGLPQRTVGGPPCSPDTESSCSFSRQDWAVLLKLKSPAELARLPRTGEASPFPGTMPGQGSPACCVNCVVGANPPIPRCKVDAAGVLDPSGD